MATATVGNSNAAAAPTIAIGSGSSDASAPAATTTTTTTSSVARGGGGGGDKEVLPIMRGPSSGGVIQWCMWANPDSGYSPRYFVDLRANGWCYVVRLPS
jgi:hypothetical protein